MLGQLAAAPERRWWLNARIGFEYDDNVVLLAEGVRLPQEIGAMANSIKEPGTLADMVASTINSSTEEKQGILECRQSPTAAGLSEGLGQAWPRLIESTRIDVGDRRPG